MFEQIFASYILSKAFSEASVEGYKIAIFLNRQIGLESLNFANKLKAKRRFIKVLREKRFTHTKLNSTKISTFLGYNKSKEEIMVVDRYIFPAKNRNKLVITRHKSAFHTKTYKMANQFINMNDVYSDKFDKNLNIRLNTRVYSRFFKGVLSTYYKTWGTSREVTNDLAEFYSDDIKEKAHSIECKYYQDLKLKQIRAVRAEYIYVIDFDEQGKFSGSSTYSASNCRKELEECEQGLDLTLGQVYNGCLANGIDKHIISTETKPVLISMLTKKYRKN